MFSVNKWHSCFLVNKKINFEINTQIQKPNSLSGLLSHNSGPTSWPPYCIKCFLNVHKYDNVVSPDYMQSPQTKYWRLIFPPILPDNFEYTVFVKCFCRHHWFMPLVMSFGQVVENYTFCVYKQKFQPPHCIKLSQIFKQLPDAKNPKSSNI